MSRQILSTHFIICSCVNSSCSFVKMESVSGFLGVQRIMTSDFGYKKIISRTLYSIIFCSSFRFDIIYETLFLNKHSMQIRKKTIKSKKTMASDTGVESSPFLIL